MKCKRCENKIDTKKQFTDDLCDDCYQEDIYQDQQVGFSVVGEDFFESRKVKIVLVVIIIICYYGCFKK